MVRILSLLLSILICAAVASTEEQTFPTKEGDLIELARHLEWDKDRVAPVLYSRSAYAIETLSESSDPTVIVPILQGYLNSPDVRSRALVLAMFFKHAERLGFPRQEGELVQIATDPKAPRIARTKAFGALLAVDWPGREELLGRLMEDQTLFSSEESIFFTSDLPVVTPRSFQPFVVQALENPSRRKSARTILAFWAMRDPAEMLPALPWLDDDAMDKKHEGMVADRVEELLKAHPKEAAAGLIANLERRGALEGRTAAELLGQLRDPSAIPVLRRMAGEGHHIDTYLGAIVQCGGLSPEESLTDLEAWAQDDNLQPLPPGESPVGYGAALARLGPPDESVVVGATGLLGKLPPAAARKLQKAIVSWPSLAARQYAVSQLDDQELFCIMMEQRSQIAQSCKPALRKLAIAGGRQGGHAMVLLGWPVPSDESAAIGYLEAACWSIRLREAPRPLIAQVLTLRQSEDRAVREAAQAYLAVVGYDVLEALQATPRAELLSLDPIERKKRKPDEPEVPSSRWWHEFEVLGRASVEGAVKKTLVQALMEDIPWADGARATWFQPRHGFRFQHRGHRYDVLLCFECRRYLCYRDDDPTPWGGVMSGSAEEVFLDAVRKKGLKAPVR